MAREFQTGSESGVEHEPLPQRPSAVITGLGEGPAGSARLHGRRRGKKLRTHQTSLLSTALPQLSLRCIAANVPIPPACSPRELPRFGSRLALAAASISPPRRWQIADIGYIGCEAFLNGIAKALALIEAASFDQCTPLQWRCPGGYRSAAAASLDGVYLLYPDPWPKRRHHRTALPVQRNVGASCPRHASGRGAAIRNGCR